jgi:hypothetical protein
MMIECKKYKIEHKDSKDLSLILMNIKYQIWTCSQNVHNK